MLSNAFQRIFTQIKVVQVIVLFNNFFHTTFKKLVEQSFIVQDRFVTNRTNTKKINSKFTIKSS